MDTAISLEDWWPWYDEILRAFGYNREEDQRAAFLLNELLGAKALGKEEAEKLIRGRRVIVFGAGPSLEGDLKRLGGEETLENLIVVTADGATSALLNVLGRVPDVVVTDLDGNMGDIAFSERRGALIVIHAHGDNIPSLRRYVHRFSKALGTTQAQPIDKIYNFGGFTDGDRAVFLAVAMGADAVTLAGMDFGDEIGRYSKRVLKSLEEKRLKLRFGKKLLEWLATKTSVKLYNLTSGGVNIRGFRRIGSLKPLD
ncbi:MAG: 6-hydroxymethylpterin diphosphokinase MptE-like protein [Candidatus Geothermarchaeales archaeon]